MTDEISDTLHEIVARLEAHGIEYMVVGSVAAFVHGRERSTQDFDVVVEASAPALRALVRSLPEERFYVSEEAAMEALRHETQFNVLDMATGWKVDLIVRKQRAFSEVEFARRSRLEVMGVSVYVASLEDTIVAKLEWAKAGGGSQRQLEDVRELVRLGKTRLDRSYVDQWVQRLGLREMWAAAVGA
jgi:predicted nucleotidyltransferase